MRKSNPTRILIVRTGALGDILHGMPAVAALRRAEPTVELSWAIEPRWAGLLSSLEPPQREARSTRQPLVDALHLVPTREWNRRPFSGSTLQSIRNLRQELAKSRFDVCVDLQGTTRSAVISRLSGAARVIGSSSPRERLAGLFYTESVSTSAAHVIDKACQLVGAAAGFPLEPATAPLPADPEAEAWFGHRFGNLAKNVLLCPGAGWGAKQWPVSSYAELASELSARGFRVLVNGGAPNQRCEKGSIFSSGAVRVNCTIRELIVLARHASLVIGGDTGPVHLAAALGRPVVALFGPTDPARNGPRFLNACVRVLRHSSSVSDYHRRPTTEAGLGRIKVDEVLQAALELVGNHADGIEGKVTDG